jgi:hypothetical protein
MSDEKSDKILADLAQVQEVINDTREHLHKVQRETPYPVPRRFRVYGNTSFPVDMLRYDSCVPDDESDSRAIEDSLDPEAGNRQRQCFVTLRKFSAGEPNYARWASYHWKVEG